MRRVKLQGEGLGLRLRVRHKYLQRSDWLLRHACFNHRNNMTSEHFHHAVNKCTSFIDGNVLSSSIFSLNTVLFDRDRRRCLSCGL